MGLQLGRVGLAGLRVRESCTLEHCDRFLQAGRDVAGLLDLDDRARELDLDAVHPVRAVQVDVLNAPTQLQAPPAEYPANAPRNRHRRR